MTGVFVVLLGLFGGLALLMFFGALEDAYMAKHRPEVFASRCGRAGCRHDKDLHVEGVGSCTSEGLIRCDCTQYISTITADKRN